MPFQLGPFHLHHRVALAPLTRCRSYNHVPQPHAAVYYGQRTTKGGLLITEATAISETSYGCPHTPGIYTDEQVEAWKPIVKALHDKGGVFICQIWHCGRASHTSYQPGGAPPPSSTNRPISKGDLILPDGVNTAPFSTPRAITTEEVAEFVEQFRYAARRCMERGVRRGGDSRRARLLDRAVYEELRERPDGQVRWVAGESAALSTRNRGSRFEGDRRRPSVSRRFEGGRAHLALHGLRGLGGRGRRGARSGHRGDPEEVPAAVLALCGASRVQE